MMIEFIETVKTEVVLVPQKRHINLYKCCECGNNFERAQFSVKDMINAHCGCKFDYTTKWKYGKQLKKRWVGINRRTINGNHPHKDILKGPYANVTISDDWKNSFKSFYTWSMDNGFKPHLHIDRIDSTKGYQADNCRWVTQSENNRNGARSKLDAVRVREILLLHGVYTNLDIARVYNIDPSTLVNICKGVIWNDVFKLYGSEKNSKRLNRKYLLPIKQPLVPGTIDFNDKYRIARILKGFLALEVDGNYDIIDLTDDYIKYTQIDSGNKSHKNFFELITTYIKDVDNLDSVSKRIFQNRESIRGSAIEYIRKIITDDIKNNYIIRMSSNNQNILGNKILVKTKN